MSAQPYKPNRGQFRNVVDELQQQSWLGSRTWWPSFIYHFTDVKNAVNVLNLGFLYSRDEAIAQSLVVQDSASSRIIDNTQDGLTSYVRFYFRPLTPTAYMNEGFRPQSLLYQGAHCPVPVYFLFDLCEVIALNDASFSDGSLARKEHRLLYSSDDFRSLPFHDIYHNRGWANESPARIDELKNRRHAEVIYPNRIALDHVKYIVCRSQAEYETLNTLLSQSVWNRWKSKVAVSKNRKLFNCEWLFINEVSMKKDNVKIGFNFPARPQFNGPFFLRVDITDNVSGTTGYYEQKYQDIVRELPGPQLTLDLSEFSSSNYTVRVSIDTLLAYLGSYRGDDIPF